MNAIKNIFTGSIFSNLKNGRGLLKIALTIAVVLAFIQIAYSPDKNYGLDYNLGSVAMASELINPDEAKPYDFYNTYWIWTSRAEAATTETDKKEALRKANLAFSVGVERDMVSSRTVDDVLGFFVRNNYIKEITPDSGDLDRMVYGSDKPSIMFIYDSNWGKDEVQKRAAIVLANLAYHFGKDFPGKINFFAYDVAGAEGYKFRSNTEPIFGREISDEFRKKGYTIKDTPDMMMYAPDLVEGTKNIELIDVLFDGPKEGYSEERPGVTFIQKDLEELPVWWIKPNLFGQSTPDKKLYRFYNTDNYHEVSGFSF